MVARRKSLGKSSRLRFSVRALLLAAACCALFLTSLRLGYQRGYDRGQTARRRETFVTTIYRVDDLVPATPGANPQPLVKFLADNVEPCTWHSAGGKGTIGFFAGNSSLVVSQSLPAHDKIRALLETLRANKARQNTGLN